MSLSSSARRICRVFVCFMRFPLVMDMDAAESGPGEPLSGTWRYLTVLCR